eukprot:TRINITY_DN3978_c0_g1_i1.p1 TRINITY_DN3978_c0_g1~~TRINITY_DN3978_c0_g1_i1.p1  ORF type:complete len:189 (-),score=50.62 TRINITY_DN3978_c0_g1_i1:80-595(-)
MSRIATDEIGSSRLSPLPTHHAEIHSTPISTEHIVPYSEERKRVIFEAGQTGYSASQQSNVPLGSENDPSSNLRTLVDAGMSTTTPLHRLPEEPIKLLSESQPTSSEDTKSDLVQQITQTETVGDKLNTVWQVAKNFVGEKLGEAKEALVGDSPTTAPSNSSQERDSSRTL